MERLVDKPPCHRCKKLKGERWTKDDCQKCLPDINEENRDAIRIYGVVRNQLILGQKGVLDINHIPIHMAMDLYNVQDKKECFEKVLTLADHFNDRLNLGL